jgi:carbon-monoxide dehydrogenase medium subunit
VVGAAALITVKDGKCSAARVAIGGLLPSARRAASVESALAGKTLSDDVIADAVKQVAADLGSDVSGDLYASAEYRSAMAPVYLKRAIAAAAARAK